MPALAAAYLFVLQLVLGSFLLAAAQANANPVDVFGNPLCITHSEGSGDTGQKKDSQLPECCTLACSMFAPLLPIYAPGTCLADHSRPISAVLITAFETGPFSRHETGPGAPRGPPAGA